jgi:membrane associated rhomboid family serine protease
MATIAEEIKDSFKRGTSLTKLIYINLAVFIFVKLVFVIFFLFTPSLGDFHTKNIYFQQVYLKYLMLPASLGQLLVRPWGVISYMFLHFEFFHILFNLLWLFWFGRIFLKYLTDKQLLSTYIIGGLTGAFLFILAYNLLPGLNYELDVAQALGASASVTAIVIAVSFYAPNYTVYIPFIGPVKIKYIAIIFIITDLLQIASTNAGGHIAHLGGALYGFLFAAQLKKGKDSGKFFNTIMDRLASVFKPRNKMKVMYRKTSKGMNDLEYNKVKAIHQKEIDRILDKIAKSGYDSLSKSEKETLFKMSKQS